MLLCFSPPHDKAVLHAVRDQLQGGEDVCGLRELEARMLTWDVGSLLGIALTRLKNSPRGRPSTVTSAADPTGRSSSSSQGRWPSVLSLLVEGAAAHGARS